MHKRKTSRNGKLFVMLDSNILCECEHTSAVCLHSHTTTSQSHFHPACKLGEITAGTKSLHKMALNATTEPSEK